MKAIIAIAPDGTIYSGQTGASAELEHCIIKFNTPEHALSESEMTYFQMARQCGITMMDSRLIDVEGTRHFLTRRFDRTEKGNIHFLATIDGREAKHVFTPKKKEKSRCLSAAYSVLLRFFCNVTLENLPLFNNFKAYRPVGSCHAVEAPRGMSFNSVFSRL